MRCSKGRREGQRPQEVAEDYQGQWAYRVTPSPTRTGRRRIYPLVW